MKQTNIIDLGKVGITVEKNLWNSSTFYERLTMVHHKESGNTYVSVEDNVNRDPSKDDGSNWILASSNGLSIYELMVARGKYTGTEEQFLADYNKVLSDATAAATTATAAATTANTAKTAALAAADEANEAKAQAAAATQLCEDATANAEAATARANTAAANAEGIKTSLDNFIAQGGGATDAQVIKNTDDIATLNSNISELENKSIDILFPKGATINLLIQDALVKNYWYNTSGIRTSIVDDSNPWYILPLIKVEPSTVYTTRGIISLAYYDENKGFVSYENVVSIYNIQHITPSNAAYVGITTREDFLNICGYYKGEYSGEKIFGEKLLLESQITGKLSIEKIEGLSNIISKSLKTIATITTSNYGTILSSANNAEDNSIYVLNFNYGSTDITGDLPYSQYYGQLDMLVTIKDTYKVQFYYGKFHGTWRRIYANSTIGWTDWERIGFVDAPNNTKEYVRSGGEWKELNVQVPTTFVVSKDGSGNYTSLTKAVMENAGKGAKIYVRGGTYDLIEEIKDYYGADYFDNPEFKHEGLIINDTEIYMDSNAFVKFIYDGANQSVVDWFSPFKFSGIGGVLKGGNIECTNCRYAIHDDTYPSSQHDSRLIDGVNIKYTSDRNTIIGGGLGQASYVEVRNCHCVNTSGEGYGIWYHNASYGDNAKSTIRIHDNYCNTTIFVQPMGVSEQITNAIISNNKCKHVGKVGTYDIDNIELIEFNNVTG